jgi:hypothetical protein
MQCRPTCLFPTDFLQPLLTAAMILHVSVFLAMVGKSSRDWLTPRGAAGPSVGVRKTYSVTSLCLGPVYTYISWGQSSPSQLFAHITKFKFGIDPSPVYKHISVPLRAHQHENLYGPAHICKRLS